MDAHSGGGRLESVLRTAAWGGAGLLFLLPVAAQRFAEGMDWSVSDFVTWAVMLLVAAGAFELSMRSSRNWAYRFGAAVAIGAAFLLVLANLAVGVIGSEGNPANLLYLGVLALGIGGAFAAEFKPRGMARATGAMAVAATAVGVLALAAGWGAGSENPLRAIIGTTVFLAGAWLLSAWLFRRAARELAGGAA